MPEIPDQKSLPAAALSSSATTDDGFRDFLKTEYTNIASAHFAAGTTITSFFQFYLLIIGLPITVAGVVQKLGGGSPTTSSGTGQSILQLLADPLVPLLSSTVGVLGLFLMWYIVTLRFDAIRYARTINGVRKRFYNRAAMSVREELAMRGLPRTITKPHYFERLYFGGIICSFATLNASYIALTAWNIVFNKFSVVNNLATLAKTYGWGIPLSGLASFAAQPGSAEATGAAAFLLFFACHWALYFFLARYQGHRYLQRQRIGIDIDGVLGDHRTAFAALLPTIANGKTLDADSIVHIPLHECDSLRNGNGTAVVITDREEHAVFNAATYWNTMPCYSDAPSVLRELKDAFRFDILIFTYRPWPNPGAYADTRPTTRTAWVTKNPQTWLATAQPSRNPGRLGLVRNSILEISRRIAMTKITETWLKQNGLLFDKLIVERGNVYVADVRSRGHNRFRFAEQNEIRVFVEDDLSKARKLAEICDFVYLIDQPYNQATDLPNNIVRVKNWTSIKKHLRNTL